MNRASELRVLHSCAGFSRLVGVLVIAALASTAWATLPVAVTAASDGPARVVLEFEMGGFTQSPVEIKGERYLSIDLAHEPRMLHAGEPALPFVTRSVTLSPRTEPVVRVLDARYYELDDVLIAPSKGNLNRTEHPDPTKIPYRFADVYARNVFYPDGPLAKSGEPYMMRDRFGVPITIHPFQYNPGTRTLRVYTSMTVEVVARGASALHGAVATRKPSAAFEELYQARFVNYEPPRYTPLDETGDLLIICHDAWIPNVQPLADHKNAIGIPTAIVGTSVAGTTVSQIKSYIQSVYDSSNLAFVLLVGDAAQVPSPSASGGASDPSYAKLAGDDDYPDIIVGRLSAETAAQVDTQVLRTIEYEENQATLTDWFWKGTGIASAEGAGAGDEGQSDDVHMDEIRDWLLGFGYTEVDQIYDTTGATAAMVTTALNEGRGIVNYCGHGSTTSWSTTDFGNSDINALENDNMLPFIITVACVNGAFTGGTCFAEAWLRATHDGEPTGAIGVYASSINQSWAPPMEGQDEFNLLYTDPNEPYTSYGALCYAGSCSMMDEYGLDGVELFDTWHIFGDPTLRIIGTTAPPTGLRVRPGQGFIAEGVAGGPFAPPSMVYTLENHDETPIDFEIRHTAAWLVVEPAEGTIAALGSVEVTVSLTPLASYLGDGTYTDAVEFINITNHDGDTARNATLKVGVPTLQFEWTFDINPLWSVEGEWEFGQPTGDGGAYGHPDPTTGATGNSVYGVNLQGDYSTAESGPHYLTSGSIDLADMFEVTLRFQRWLNTDYQSYAYATVEVSNDGGSTWHEVWNNGTSTIADDSWTLRTIDVSAYADDQTDFRVRWGYEIGSGAWAYSGWNIDDVQIWARVPSSGPELCAGDMNCDGAVDFDDIDRFVTAFHHTDGLDWPYECPWINADCSGDGDVTFEDIDPFVERMGASCD